MNDNMVLHQRSSSVKSDENSAPERPAVGTISTFTEVGPDGPESPQGYTHPAFYRTGPVKIEKQLHLLTLDAVKQWQNEIKTPTSPLTGRPNDNESFWPPELVNKHHSPSAEKHPRGFFSNKDTFTEPSVSGSPNSLQNPTLELQVPKIPTVQVTSGEGLGEPAKPLGPPPKVTRKRSQRMWNFTNIDEQEERTVVPDKILYHREIELWRSDVIRNGASMVGIQDGLTIFCRKMGEPKPNALILNTFGAFLDKSIAQLVEVKEFFEEHHHHLSERENTLLRGQLTSYKRILDQQDARIRELEKKLNHKLDLEDED
ncbi:hypothetical protein TWF569_009791 [Orbilia oligospora]|uniref:Uncharacterized protein n=2 Tax=Orbilia oligospora TaxID=2813651 RepID=A0A7C8JGL7_ORBOL|nr:hypothetical protein TWF102_004151 [Orbilia oligospora]KAF3117682.1 hypothetical protein TWF103_004363 [Orbilia oligospora]KAF3155265.1 hypothetical protein TWF569_009791 [Orbilia oligospora]